MTQQHTRPGARAKQTPLERFMALPLVQYAKPFSRGWRLCCPVHGDQKESMQFWEDESDGHVAIQCFVGCSRADICAALGISESTLYVNARPPISPAGPPRKLDLLDLALAKLIHPGVFISVQMEDGYTWSHPEGRSVPNVVRIPYFLEDGTPYRRNRIRTAITAKSGSYWEGAEAPIIPYGLWKLEEARKQKTLWLVEGESDCWTHWYHGIPTLGLPGATNTSMLEAAHLQDIDTLYIVQEPTELGKKQDAGKAFVDGLCKQLRELHYHREVYVVSLKHSHNVKDPNDLHKKLFLEGRVHDYVSELGKAIREATPLDLNALTLPQAEQLAELQPLLAEAIAKQDTTALYELAPRIANLETKDQAMVATMVKQGMKQSSGFSQRAFHKLMKEALATQQGQQHIRVTHKPDILLTGDLEQDSQATLMALYSANIPPVLFVRGGKLARCRTNEEGKPAVEELSEAILLYEMTRAANFLSYNQSRESYVATYPPAAIARYILSQPTWKFPPLKGVTEVPVVRDDGTILDTAGYDPQSRLIYLPHPELVIPPIPANPTRQDIEDARDLAWGYIAEFPYETRADAANAFALLLTVVIRTLVSLVPLAIIDATKQGSGKGLLSKFVSHIALGRSAAAMVPPNDENEWRKTLTSLILEGETLISLDNVEGLLYSPTLASFLTADVWKARLLGTMQSPDLAQRTMMIANGNNMQLGGDIPRRSYRIRMDAGVSKPWMRTGFTYSPLLKYAQQDRGKILAALLTMVRAWYIAGQPAPAGGTPALAEFSTWSEIVGGILAYASVDGFLSNLAQLYDETDTEGPQWTGFLEMWHTVLGSEQYTTAQVIDKLKTEPTFASALPEALAGLPLDEPKEMKAFSIKLGRALQKRNGTPYGPDNHRLKKAEDSHTKQKLWGVTSVPVAQTKPVRLLWSLETPPPSHSDQATPILAKAAETLPDERAEQTHLEYPVSEECEAPGCTMKLKQDEAFTYDVYGHGWCHAHANRGQVLELARNLKTPFPLLFYARGRMLEAQQQAYEAFVLTATENNVHDVLRGIESHRLREEQDQRAREQTM